MPLEQAWSRVPLLQTSDSSNLSYVSGFAPPDLLGLIFYCQAEPRSHPILLFLGW
jgi:hypothetical protein